MKKILFLLTLGVFFCTPTSSNAATELYFGGKIVFAIPCSCSDDHQMAVKVNGPKKYSATYLFDFQKTKRFKHATIPRSLAGILGTYKEEKNQCITIGPEGCPGTTIDTTRFIKSIGLGL